MDLTMGQTQRNVFFSDYVWGVNKCSNWFSLVFKYQKGYIDMPKKSKILNLLAFYCTFRSHQLNLYFHPRPDFNEINLLYLITRK